MNYFISDMHFGHENSLAFDNRPFTDIAVHDQTIIDRWNDTVSDEDDVFILGDVSWYNVTKTIEIVKQLNGKKHLIKGNHDDKLAKNKDFKSLFIEVCNYRELYVGNGKAVVLCHYPMPTFKNHYHGWYHLYGHVHNSWEWNVMENTKRLIEERYNYPCNMYNVGCMLPYMDYTPRTLEEIIKANEKEKTE